MRKIQLRMLLNDFSDYHDSLANIKKMHKQIEILKGTQVLLDFFSF